MPTVATALNNILSYKKGSGADLRVNTSQNNMQNYNGNPLNGVPTSPIPYIKNEPLGTPPDHSKRFSQNSFPETYTMSGNGGYHQSSHYGGQNYESIDPSALGLSPISTVHEGSMPRNIPIPQNGYNSFNQNLTTTAWSTAELLELQANKDSMSGFSNGDEQFMGYNNLDTDLYVIEHGTLDSGYSQTPDNGQQYQVFRPFNGTSMENPPYSPFTRHPIDINGNHKSPHPKSPNTPKTPGLLHGDAVSMPIQNHHMSIHRHHKSLPSAQWDGTPSSQVSYVDSPLSSPGVGSTGHLISEVMGGKHASLPTTKVESIGAQTQEAKRRKRRESHNMVERRRRDNINEKIQELSHLVPQHRLEDDKVRKHLQNNSPLSPTIAATGASPPRATSMLAGGTGRRASGVQGAGLPGDEKDKSPNKGDILNGAVAWTRDLMWCLHEKYKQEEQLRKWAAQNGLQFPIEPTEEEKRMKSELMASIGKNTSATRRFTYTRGPGSGLRVPGYTDIAGMAITVGTPGLTSPSVSPVHASVSGANNTSGAAATSLSRVQSQQPQFWPNDNNMTFKEEENFGGMDLTS